MVPLMSESPSSIQGYLLGNIDDGWLLIIFDDNAIVLETHRLNVFTNLVYDPCFRGAFAVHRVAPYAPTF